MVLILVAIAIVFAILTGGTFLTSRNISNLFLQASAIGIVAISVSLVLVAGEIDLYLAGSVWLLALIGSIIWMMAAFYPYSPLATMLQIPYLCWCLFATFLSFGVAKLNKKHT